jgi:large subunit ribosomal protein L21
VFAVIRAGGKQFKVSEGDVLQIEKTSAAGDTVRFTPLLVVDDAGAPRSGKQELAAAVVTATVLDEVKGPKVDIFRYRNKTGYRRHIGHRQRYTSVRISGIELGDGGSSAAAPRPEGEADGS